MIFGFTLGLGRVARMVPLAVVLPTLLLLLVQLLMDMRPGLAQAYRRWEQKDLFQVEPLRKQASQQMEKEDMERRQGDRERQAFFWLLAMLALLYFLGFLVALPLYTLWYLRQHSEGWLKPMVIAAGIAGFVYGVSILDPGASLYGGWLGHWLGR
ncbi:MAG: tripartite tricarboxylate transporter TctB family protein [Acidobacteria bacterium]|nr:tripartite tricarboxylate transporter TctB family protein [Acidobacteriota bacterium]